MRALVLINPQAHSGRAGRQVDALKSAFEERGLEATFHLTTAPGEATKRVATLAPGEHDTVISAGGDGTLFEVVNGLMWRPETQREALGVLPLGTGNAFARDLGLAPGDLDGALDLLEVGRTRPVDVAEVTTPDERFHFVNMLGAGFVVRAARAALALKALGRGAYTLGALAALLRLPSQPFELELDGRRLEPLDTLFIQVANSRYTGTHFLMAPGARIDDGLLDVVHVRRLPRRRVLRLFPTIYDGRHVEETEVTVHRAREIRLLAPVGSGCIVDGEPASCLPLTIRCVPAALQVFGAGT